MAGEQVTFWAYIKQFRIQLDEDGSKWARDNILWGIVVAVLPIIVGYFVNGRFIDWQLLVTLFWAYAATIVVYVLVHMVRTPWRLHQKMANASRQAENRAKEYEAQIAKNSEEYERKEAELRERADADAAHPWLALVKERQRLELELQPLLEIEEAGVKILPTLKLGKDAEDYRRERIARLRRDIGEIGKKLTSEQAESQATKRDWAGDWKELAGRFKEETRYRIRADWCKNSLGESWNITGGDAGPRRTIESLCKHAGDLLVASPRVSQRLSPDLLRLPIDRWLNHLKTKTTAFEHVGYGVETLDTGEKSNVLLGSIGNLAEVSANECMECSSEEY